MSYVRGATLPLDVLGRDRTRRRLAIERAAQAELRRSSHFAVRGIDCEYSDGVLTLRGRLPSFFLKQMAQSVVSCRLDGVAVVDNQLQVTQNPPGVAAY